MADWPDLDELKQVLDVTSEDWDGDDDDTRLTGVLQSAIAIVKSEVGNWDDGTDTVTTNLSRAALRMAELLALRPEGGRVSVADATVAEQSMDPTFQWYMRGARRRFAFG